jgi:hypothetical protein
VRTCPGPDHRGGLCRRLAEADLAALLEAVNAVRPKLWTGRGKDLLGPIAYLDVDGTIAPTTGQRKQGMDMSYKGIWGATWKSHELSERTREVRMSRV